MPCKWYFCPLGAGFQAIKVERWLVYWVHPYGLRMRLDKNGCRHDSKRARGSRCPDRFGEGARIDHKDKDKDKDENEGM